MTLRSSRCVRLVAAFLLYAVAPACAHQVTAPEVKAILRDIQAFAVEPGNLIEPVERNEPVEHLWDTMHWSPLRHFNRLFETVQPLTVGYAGTPREYHGFVIEWLNTPPRNRIRNDCVGARSALLLWRGGAQPDGIVFSGGRFDTAVGPAQVCDGGIGGVLGPEPVVFAHPRPDDPDQAGWMSHGGTGRIGPGREIGPCVFLTPGAVSALAENRVTCTLTRSVVNFSALLSRSNDFARSTSLTLALARTEVLGIRLKVDCTQLHKGPWDLCRLHEP